VRLPVALSSARGSKQRDRTILVVDDHVAFAEALASVVEDVPGLHAFAATTTEQAQRAIAEFDPTFIRLVRTQVDVTELGYFLKVAGEGIGGGDGVGTGLDCDDAVAAGGADELAD
jgi:hypothetical protein